MQEEPRRILLVEDDGGMIRSVEEAIDDAPNLHFVGYLTGRANLDKSLDEHAPDVALVDIGLMRPGQGMRVQYEEQSFDEGLWIIARIGEYSPHTKVIGFSNYFIDNPELTKQALDHGADALIAKQSGPSPWQAWSQWLRSEINAVLFNYWRMSPEVARILTDEEEERRQTQPDAPLPLTPRQMEVLHCLASGMSDNEIAEKLVIEAGAVRGHIANIKKRLQMRYRWQVIDEARRRGIGIDPPDSD